MKKLYEASNVIEAHMIVNLLEQAHIQARIDGEYLQGGIGELPASGLIRVMVDEDDYDAARRIIDEWDAAQPRQAALYSGRPQRNGLGGFAAGLLAGVACTCLFFSSPLRFDALRHSGDGVPSAGDTCLRPH